MYILNITNKNENLANDHQQIKKSITSTLEDSQVCLVASSSHLTRVNHYPKLSFTHSCIYPHTIRIDSFYINASILHEF